MKKVIVNNDKIRVTANGQSIVEGSFARVTEIRGKSVKCNNLIHDFVASENDYWKVEVLSTGGIKVTIKEVAPSTNNWVKISNQGINLSPDEFYTLSGFSSKKSNGELGLHISRYNENYNSFETPITFTPQKDNNDLFSLWVLIGYYRNEQGQYETKVQSGDWAVFYPMLNEGETAMQFQRPFDGIKDSKINGILSHNRNLLNKQQSQSITGSTGEAFFSNDLIDLINSKNVHSLTMSSNFKSNKIIWTKNNLPRLFLYLTDTSSTNNAYFKTFFPVNNGTFQKRQITAQLDKSKYYILGSSYFNYYEIVPVGINLSNSYISYQNQLEISETPTRYVESETYKYDLPSEITLRSSIDNESIYDVYYPEQGLIIRCINEDGTIKSTPIFEDITPIAYNGYKAFNNGFEKLVSSVDNGLTPYDYGAIPEIVVEYEIEPKQGADRTRFDFITLDGEAICGIGYEKLKSTNQLQYVEEPDRQNDGSMSNIEDYDTFVLPALEVGFNCINEETYRRLKHKLISKRTFDVGYYDKDLDKVVTMEMYVKPIDLDNFLSYGDDIIGMNFSISFVPTLNEETLFSVTFLNSDYNTIIKEYSGNNGVLYGRAIETPSLPSGYKYWLMIESGFKENTFVKIKGNKKLSIFGNTKLIAVK